MEAATAVAAPFNEPPVPVPPTPAAAAEPAASVEPAAPATALSSKIERRPSTMSTDLKLKKLAINETTEVIVEMVFPYERLQAGQMFPDGCNASARETHLSTEEFVKYLECNKVRGRERA